MQKKRNPQQQVANRLSKELSLQETDLTLISEPEKKLQELILAKEQERIKKIRDQYAGHSILGFTVYLMGESKNGKVYRYWQAQKWDNTKHWSIRLGSNLEKAEEKIRNFCQEKGIPIE